MLIALSLVTGTVASAWAATKAAAQMSDTASGPDAMADCYKTAKKQGAAHCPSCDTGSMCADQLSCIKKCGSQIVAYLVAEWRLALPSPPHDGRIDPPEPPDWVISPPAPPPRA